MISPSNDEELYLSPEVALASPTPEVRTARALNTILRIGTSIHRSNSLEGLASGILEHLLSAVPADRGAILLYERWSPQPASIYCFDRVAGAGVDFALADDAVERAYQEGVVVLSNSGLDSGLAGRSVLAAPLFGRDKLAGIIYLESSDPAVIFERDHLQLTTAIGVMAGAAIENARYTEWLRAENARLNEEFETEHGIIGESARMREVFQFIGKVARTDSTVLVTGESGTGKELVARAIHASSLRTGKPFVAVNCAAITETLLESEMFGHERGAFTGAATMKKGKLEAADGGTIFLDEVGELPLGLQAKLLRALQERQFERVGGTRPLSVDIRVVAATNRDLKAAVAAGTFRQDLYYRLNVVSLEMPPLRERREDIPALAGFFATKHSRRAKRHVAGISPEATVYLLGYDWPGNVRELENAIERAIVLGSTELVLPEDLPDCVLDATCCPNESPETYHEAVRRQKRERILQALELSGGNITEAAKRLGLHPNYLHRLIRNLHLKEEIRRATGAA